MNRIIPLPKKIAEKDGWIRIKNDTNIYAAKGSEDFAENLAQAIRSSFTAYNGRVLPDSEYTDNEEICVIQCYINLELDNEEYIIDVSDNALSVSASSQVGFSYAMTTLRQLIGFDLLKNMSHIDIENVYIRDYPTHSWRGLMLDESRHFFGVHEVKRLLELMALNKLNKFHWHLSDDQGFRIEIKKYPLLVHVGSIRRDTQIGGWNSKRFSGAGHSGYYTQSDVRDIIAYASSLGIEIIPEIDMPGHMTAMLAAYPKLGCTGEKYAVSTDFGIKDTVACPSSEYTYEFLHDVIDELCELFPSQYFHIGGDEVPYTQWKACEHCQKFMKENNLANEKALQTYFTNKIAEYLIAKNKTPIAWDDALSDTLNENVIIQYYTTANRPTAINQLKNGRKFIMSRTPYTYLDYPYASTPLRKCYSTEIYSKEFEDLDNGWQKNILGAEACLWTEWVYDREKLDFNLFPRLCAIAERAWGVGNPLYSDFTQRLEGMLKILECLNVNYARPEMINHTSSYRRWRDNALWHNSDQYCEVRRNRKYRS